MKQTKPNEQDNGKETEVSEDIKEKENANDDEVINEDKTVELNHEELLKGDFLSIAGEYVNSEGDVIEINNEGLRTDIVEVISSDVIFHERTSKYNRTLWSENHPSVGYAMSIFPVGTEIKGLDTDVTKIRIGYGQDYPGSLEYIYTKK